MTNAYVSLGDSISIDVYAGGPGRGGASLLFANRDDDFPEWKGRDLSSRHPGLRFVPLAVDGGTCRHVLASQLPRLESLPVIPSTVTLTVGGNDVLAAYGRTGLARGVIAEVRRSVGETLVRLRALMPSDGQVVVGTVYDPSDGTADAAAVDLPPWPEVVDVLGELNDALRSVAAEHGAAVADIHARFLGHGLQAGDPAQPHARPAGRALWFCRVIEPNAWGADGVRGAFWEALSFPG